MGTTLVPKLDSARLSIISECMENYDVGDGDAEWPNNIISREAVVYSDGTIARRTDRVSHMIDGMELALCERLSKQAAQFMAGIEVGMGSESGDCFRDFFIAAAAGAPKPTGINEDLIRKGFGGTLFPLATITVEPFAEDTVWWSEVLCDGEESGPDYFVPWREMSAWFKQQPAFVGTAFVRIGDQEELFHLPEASLPEGTATTGCVLPRLALGLTHNGSLAGLFGHVVHT